MSDKEPFGIEYNVLREATFRCACGKRATFFGGVRAARAKAKAEGWQIAYRKEEGKMVLVSVVCPKCHEAATGRRKTLAEKRAALRKRRDEAVAEYNELIRGLDEPEDEPVLGGRGDAAGEGE